MQHAKQGPVGAIHGDNYNDGSRTFNMYINFAYSDGGKPTSWVRLVVSASYLALCGYGESPKLKSHTSSIVLSMGAIINNEHPPS
jgi:hypothetical protein